jgi:formylglycine-generating enzyme required for sulfatase activity
MQTDIKMKHPILTLALSVLIFTANTAYPEVPEVDSEADPATVIEAEAESLVEEVEEAIAPTVKEIEVPAIIELEPVPAEFPEMVLVKEGEVKLEEDGDGVLVPAFYIGVYEVTWADWQKVQSWSADNGYDLIGVGDGCGEDHPVHSVSWFDVLKWCNALSEMQGLRPVYYADLAHNQIYRRGLMLISDQHKDFAANGYRLPTMAEWQFAAQGGNESTGFSFAGGDEPDQVGWFVSNSHGAETNLAQGCGTWPVGLKLPNELGIYDMSGNVWEWVWDASTEHRPFRIMLGGGWFSGMETTRLTEHRIAHPADRYIARGFRLARTSAKAGEEAGE